MNDKTQLRKQLRAKRQALTSFEQSHAADQVLAHFISQPNLTHHHKFAAYFANDGELNPSPIIQWLWQAQKSVYLPVLLNKTLGFALYTPETALIKNQFGIDEPVYETVLMANELEVIMLPLVAFDSRGQRLGRGAGYYDRALAEHEAGHTPLLLGLAHECQHIDEVPNDSWDVPLDVILTETKIHQP